VEYNVIKKSTYSIAFTDWEFEEIVKNWEIWENPS